MTARHAAWRNMMVAAINAGLEQGWFGLEPGDNRWPGAERHKPHMYGFDVGGITALASVSDGGHDELWVHVALWPTHTSYEWINHDAAGLRAGEAFASGWVERRLGAWLQVGQSPRFNCRKDRLNTVEKLRVKPQGYADNGRFML